MSWSILPWLARKQLIRIVVSVCCCRKYCLLKDFVEWEGASGLFVLLEFMATGTALIAWAWSLLRGARAGQSGLVQLLRSL